MHSKRNETEDRNLSSFRPDSSPEHQASPFRHEMRMTAGSNFPPFQRQAFSQMPHSNTFMTSAFGDHNYRMEGYFDDKQEELRNTYNALQNVIADLDVSFDRVLERHEKDFLSAYRGHMMKVQRELNFLRNKAKEQEIKLKKDERINNLQNSLDWFRKEALKLGKTCEFQKKEIDKYKAKSDSYEEDMKFLEQQIKAAKKQNKLLKVALGKSQHQCEQLIAIAEENLPHQKMESILREAPQSIDFSEEEAQMRMGITSSSFNTRVHVTLQQEVQKALPAPQYTEEGPDITKELDIDGDMPNLPQMIPELESQEKKDSTEIAPPPAQSSFMPRSGSRPRTTERKKTQPLQSAKAEFSLPGNKRFQNFLVNLFESNPDRPTLMNELASFFNQYDQRVEQVIQNLKGQLEAEKRLSRKLKNIKTEEISERNKYENIFFDCVESVKREVLKRKNAQSQSRLMTKKSESTLRKLSKAEEPQFTELLKTKPENFTSADKKKVLEIFVVNEEVLLCIYESLFVKNKSALNEKMRRTNEPSFNSNPLSSAGFDIELDNQKFRDAFLTKVPGEDEDKDLTSGRLEREQKARFKTSVMPQSVNHGIGQSSMLGEFTQGARRIYSSQPSTKARTTANSFNLAPGKIRRSKNSELIRGVDGNSKIRSATRGARALYQ